MKTNRLRLAVFLGLATLPPASALIAQTSPVPLLNEVEVRHLIERGEPADHARLSAHFTLLAERYEADAKRHEAMGQAFSGNPKLAAMASSQREHCRQLSARNLGSATTLRELAAHHRKLGAGVPSEVPNVGKPFQRGSGAPAPSDQDLTRLAAATETAADHRALEEYFTSLATGYEQDAKQSATYATTWLSRVSKDPSASRLAARWERLAQQQRASASDAQAAAALHKAQAAAAR